jgi:hypothetical protein
MTNPLQRQQQVSNQRNVPDFIGRAPPNTGMYRNSSISSLAPSTQTSHSFMDCFSRACNKFLRLFAPIFGMSEKRLEYTKEGVRASLNIRLRSLHSYQGKIFVNMKVGTKFQQFSYHTSGGMNAMNDAIRKALVFFENEFKDNPFARDYGFTTCCFERGYFMGADELRAHFDFLEGKTWGIFYSEEKSKGSYAWFNAALLGSNDRREQVIQYMNEKANLSLTQNDLFGNDHQLALT